MFTRKILDTKIRERGLVNKYKISNPIKNSDLYVKLITLTINAESKADQDNILTKVIYFQGNFFFQNNSFQNMFVYQTTFSTLVLKEYKNNE